MRLRTLAVAGLAAMRATQAVAEIKTSDRASGRAAFGGVTSQGDTVCGATLDERVSRVTGSPI